MLVSPDAIGQFRTSNGRILHVLNLAPFRVSTEFLVQVCCQGMAFPKSNARKALDRLCASGHVEKIKGGYGHNRFVWKSTKWSTIGSVTMSESVREDLPARRRCVSQKVKIGKQTVHYSIGLYPDGRPGELWIEVAKAGAALRGWAGEAGMMMSIALQHGTPLHTVLDLFIGTRNDPCGPVVGHDRITQCTSIMDLIARDMAITFLQREDLADVDKWSVVPVPISDRAELPTPVEGQTCVCHTRK